MTSTPASSAGGSTRCPTPASSATRPGEAIRGNAAAARTSGRSPASTRNSGWPTSHWARRRTTTTAGTARAPTSSETAWWRWTAAREAAAGTSSPSTTISGIGTCPRSRHWSRSSGTALRSRQWRSPPRQDSSSCSIGRRANPCSTSRSTPPRSVTCPASTTTRPSPGPSCPSRSSGNRCGPTRSQP